MKNILTNNNNSKMSSIIKLLENSHNLLQLFILDDNKLGELFNHEEFSQDLYSKVMRIVRDSLTGGKKRKTFKKNKRINKMRKGGWTYKGSPSLDSKSSVITDTSSKTNSKTRSKSSSSKSKSKSKSKTNRNNKKHKTKKVIKRSRR